MTIKRKRRRRRRKKATHLVWLWEFSKKVVATAFLLYVVSFAYVLIVAYLAITLTADSTALTTIVTETNETFRVVVGGYLLKAGGENIAKIVTAYLEKGKVTNEDNSDTAAVESGHL